MQADHYDVLGVSKTASPDEIKRAYRKLARQHHPDKNPGDKHAEEKFKEVGKAFEILSNPEKRKLYDELGHDAEKIGYDPEKAAAYRQWAGRGGGAPGAGGKGGAGVPFDLGDIFGDLRGGGFDPFGRRPRRQGPTRGEDIQSTIRIPFEEAVKGTTTRIRLERPAACATCKGSGTGHGGAPRVCSACAGSGRRTVRQGAMNFQLPCNACGGGGQEPADACSACAGSGRKAETTRLDVKVPVGIDHGQKIRLGGKGAAGLRGGPPGDLLLTVHVDDHPLFKRSGRDLELELPVTVPEALLGAQVEVPTLDGKVRLKIPAGTQTGAKLRLRGKGVPKHQGREAGDLFARVRVVLPDPGTDRESAKKAADLLKGLYPGDVRRGMHR